MSALPIWLVITLMALMLLIFVVEYIVFNKYYNLLRGNSLIVGIVGILLIICIGWLLAVFTGLLITAIVICILFSTWISYLFCLAKLKRERRMHKNENQKWN